MTVPGLGHQFQTFPGDRPVFSQVQIPTLPGQAQTAAMGIIFQCRRFTPQLPVSPIGQQPEFQAIGIHQQISGTTGYTTGPHLHFEVLLDGLPIDPLSMVEPIG